MERISKTKAPKNERHSNRLQKKPMYEGQGWGEEVDGQGAGPYSLQRMAMSGPTPISKGATSKIQRLTITRNGNPTIGNCGSCRVRWNFALDAPAPEDGYIVQKVRRYEDINACPSETPDLPASPDLTFWEAWWVRAGDTMQRKHVEGIVNYTDASSIREHPSTAGASSSRGEVRFYPTSVTGDLGREDQESSDPNSDWGPGRVAFSHWLPSTRVEPAWWSTAPIEGSPTRHATRTWNCCEGTSRTEFDASP